MSSNLPIPTIQLIREYGAKFDNDPATALVENAIAALIAAFPRNTEVHEVLLKVAAINSLYSAHVYAVHAVADHIASSNIDPLLAVGDPGAVETIAKIPVKGGNRTRRIYSLASKYCSWHNQGGYAIYDSRARDTLWAYRRELGFHDFSSDDLWCENGYERYRDVVDAFRKHFGLEALSYKEIDKFLYWLDPRSAQFEPGPGAMTVGA